MEIRGARSSRLLPKVLPVAWASSMWDRMRNLNANWECLISCQRGVWAPVLKGIPLWMWPHCQPRKIPTFVSFCAVSEFVGCLRLLPVLSRAASWNFGAFGLFGLELGSKHLWSDPAYLPGTCKLSFCPAQQELSSRTWLLRSQLCGAARTVAAHRQTGFVVLLRPCLVLPHLLLCFPFLIPLLLSWTQRSVQRTTRRNHSAHRCLVHNLDRRFASRQSPVQLCTGAVILLTWFCNGAYLFLLFIQRDEWLLYLQVSTIFNPNSNCQANDFLFFRFGTLPLQHRGLLPVAARYHIFLNILGYFSTFHMITLKWYISTNH